MSFSVCAGQPLTEALQPEPEDSSLNASAAGEQVTNPEVSDKGPVDKSAQSTYGPPRNRITGKNGPDALWRPPAMRQDDFVAIMEEVTPELITNIIKRKL